jgi:hypothetical protein
MVRYDDESDTLPHETILSKLEVTEMGPIDVYGTYNSYARQQLVDRTPEAVLFESEKNFKRPSKSVLNLRFNGDPYGKKPNHPELMLADTTPDPRGPDGNPLMWKMRKHREVRSREEAKKMHNQSEQDTEGSLQPSEVMSITRRVNKRYADNIKFWGRTLENDVRTTQADLKDPMSNFKYIMNQDIDSDLVETRPGGYMQRSLINNFPKTDLKWQSQTTHLPGNDYVSMSKHQKGALSKQIVNAAKRVEVQELQDGLEGAKTCKSSTPGDVAKIYRDIKHDQVMNDQSMTAINSRSATHGDTIKTAGQSVNSEGFITGPDGYILNSNGMPTGTGGANRDPLYGHETLDITTDANNRTQGNLPSGRSTIGMSQMGHPNVYINNALIITKAMKLPDARKRRVQMADVQHAGIVLSFNDPHGKDNIRMMKSMLPIVNNHMVAQNSEYFINNPGLAYDTESGNITGQVPNYNQSRIGQSDINLSSDRSNTASVQKSRQRDTFKSPTDAFTANDDSLLFSDNTGLRKGGSRIGSGFLRQSDASDINSREESFGNVVFG